MINFVFAFFMRVCRRCFPKCHVTCNLPHSISNFKASTFQQCDDSLRCSESYLRALRCWSLQPTVNFRTQKRDTAIRDLLALRNYCKNGFFCENYQHCCPDGWGCCASSLFFPTLRLHFHSQLNISQMVAAASVSQGEYLLALKISTI
jgi:hypothetical protein